MADKIDQILKFKHIAIVGLSRDFTKQSNKVGLYLKTHGYEIVPVNPVAEEVLGETAYSTLLEIPTGLAADIEVVEVFRPSKEALEILLQTLKLREAYGKVKAVWLQEGIKNPKAKKLAEKAGLWFVQDRCMKKEHEKRFKKRKKAKR